MAAAAIPLLVKALPSILSGVMGIFGSDSAGKKLAGANNAALSGVLGAAGGGMTDVSAAAGQGITGNNAALGEANELLHSAGVNATANVNDVTGLANAHLTGAKDASVDALNPYLQAGQQGLTGLGDLLGGMGTRPEFSFNYDDYKADPAYDLIEKSGLKAIQNSGAARGLGSSGAIMQELGKFSGGVAASKYQDAFGRAKDSYTTNRDTDLADKTLKMGGLGDLIGAGKFGVSEFNDVVGDTAGKISGNLTSAGKYAGDTQLSIADALSKLGIDVSKANSNTGLEAALANSKTGLQAAGMAGDYAVAGAGGDVAGGIGSRAALGGTMTSIADLIGGLLKKKGG